MPLFMLISGYLFAFSINKGIKKNISNKLKVLIIPIFTWAFVPVCFHIINNWTNNLSFNHIFNLYFSTAIHHLWFLWAVFWCSSIVLCIFYFMKNNIYIYISLWIFSFFIPDNYNIGLYKFMFPYFVIGFLYNFKTQLKQIQIHKNIYFHIMTGLIFSILLFFYNRNAYIYTSGHYIGNNNIIIQMTINLYRYVIGLIGSIFIILTIIRTYTYSKYLESVFTYIGQRTMGIYIISGFINIYILTSLTYQFKIINFWIISIETICTLILSLITINIIQHNKIFNRLLLGSK